MGQGQRYTEGRTPMEWMAHLYGLSREKSAQAGVTIPSFERVLGSRHRRSRRHAARTGDVCRLPRRSRKASTSRRHRARSRSSPRRSIYRRAPADRLSGPCRGGSSRSSGWPKTAERYPLHMLSDQRLVMVAQPARPFVARKGDQGEGPPRADHACIPRSPMRQPAAFPRAISATCSTIAAPALLPPASAIASAAASYGSRPARGSIRPMPAQTGRSEKHGNPNAR